MNKTNSLTPIVYTGTNEQLHDFLMDRGLFIPSFDGKFDRKRAIRALQQWEIQNPDKPDRVCHVVFHYSRHPSANTKYAQATINGRKWVFPYEKDCEVPEYVLKECIDRAEETSTAPLQDGNDITKNTHRVMKTKIYPYSFLGYVLKEEQVKEKIQEPVNVIDDSI